MFKRIALVVVVFAAVAVTTPASPVQLSYVYSDSMEPTISQNDGYVVVPEQGRVEQRDVVMFWSSEREEYVTHRVVGRSSAGLITQGDNNDVTDQAAGYAYVQREDVAGTVLTYNGDPVVIPGLGVFISLVDSHRTLVLATAGVLVAASVLYGSGSRNPKPGRTRVTVSDVMHPLFAMALLLGVAFLLLGASSQELTYVAVDGNIGGANTLTVGENTTERVLVDTPAMPFTQRVVSTDGMTITNQTVNASAVSARTYIPGPTEPGAYTTGISVHRYPTVLPEGALQALHGIHPAVAATATVGILLTPLFLLYALVLDGRQSLRMARSRWLDKLGGESR